MMGFHAASGLVSVISASHSRDYCVVLLFTVLFSNSNLYVYIEDGNTLTQKSRTLCKLPFAIEVATKGHNQAFYKAHHRAIPA